MDFNRRGFLRALIAGASVAAAAAVAGPAFASTPNKYQRLINSQQTILGFQRIKTKAGPQGGDVYTRAKDGINRNIDSLLDLLNEEFDGTPEMEADFQGMLEKVSKIFNRELVIDTMSEADLVRYENTLVVIATMRYLLANCRITFDPNGMKGWDLFADRYCQIIIKA